MTKNYTPTEFVKKLASFRGELMKIVDWIDAASSSVSGSTIAVIKSRDSFDIKMAEALDRSLTKNFPDLKPRKPADVARWVEDFRRLREIDGKTPDDIVQVLAFSQMDSFWAQNIRSGTKFRKQYETLSIKRLDRATNNNRSAF
jgi:hypothetical protein